MNKNNNTILHGIVLVIVTIGLIAAVGCQIDPGVETPTEEDPLQEETPELIPPPENLLGTIALTNGKSAVMDLQFDSASSNYLPGTAPRATLGVTGKVRYEGEDYTVGGLYNDETGILDIFAENSSGQRFVFSGSYTPGSGFSGTVTLYASDHSTVIAEGSVHTTEATDEERSTIKIYTGTFGGDAYGVWNGTLTTGSFYGTWSGDTPGGPASGTFSMTRSGNSLSNLTGSNGPVGGSGTLSGTTSSGWWAGQDSTSGSWTGAEVDANYDQHVPTAGDDSSYLANIILQAFENGLSLYNNAVDESDYGLFNDNGDGTGYRIGPTVGSITSTAHFIFNDPDWVYSHSVYDFASYADNQTGLELSGELLIEAEQNPYQLIIDSDTSNASEDAGLTITFPDTPPTTAKLFVDVEIDYMAETIGPNNLAGATWELEGVDVLSDVISVFF